MIITRPVTVAAIAEPDASNTGVLPGSNLTVVSGNQTVTVAGTVLQNLDIYGRVIVKAANVKLINCRVRASGTPTTSTGLVDTTNSACKNFYAEHCTIVPDTPSLWYTGIMGHDYYAYKCNIYNTTDTLGVFNTNDTAGPISVTIDQCYAHDLSFFSPDPGHSDNMTHNDCLQIQGGSGLRIVNSAFHANYATAAGVGTRPLPTGTAAQLSCVMIAPVTTAWTISDVYIADNWFYGGKIAVNIGDDRNLAGVNMGRIWRNKFDRSQAMVGHTIDLQSGVICDTGDGTTNRNIYMDDGSEVTVRHNA